MAIGTLTQKLRPVRIAFLVDPTDKDSVQQSIHINSLLWGGMFNPLIPCYKRLPKIWVDHKSKSESAFTVIKGYIEGFDPDFFVNLSGYSASQLGIEEEDIVQIEDILKSFREDSAPTVGAGIFEVLNQFIYDELRFIRKDTIDFIKPNIDGPHKLFLSSIYGDLGEFEDLFYKNYLHDFEAKEKTISIKYYLEFAKQKYMFPRRLGAEYLEQRLRGSFLFYLDASVILDVIDYWNLRAAGFYVVPFPKQAENEEPVKKLAENVIESGYWPYRHNKDRYHHASLIKSRSTKNDEIKKFSESLNIKKSEKDKGIKFSLQHWYPRIWNEWARRNTQENIIPAYSKEKDIDLLDGQNEFRIKALDPEFDIFYANTSGPRFANEIDSRIYGHDELLAQAIPLGGEHLSHIIGKYSLREWRISKTGPVYMSNQTNWSISYEPPLAEPVMKAWFKEQGWDVELSPSGKIAKQMINQLGGIWGISNLKHEKLIKLFQDLNNKDFVSENDFKGRIARIVNEDSVWIERDQFIQKLLEKNIFQLGVQIVCPTCTQKTWYSLEGVSNAIQCSSCLNDYNIQSIGLDEKQWAYKATGTFGLPKQAYGAYSVLLTLHTLTRDHHEKVTPMLSFDAKKGNKEIEADLCLFTEKEFRDETIQELVFAECKTYNKFEKKDIERMKTLAKEFPGSVLVLATMRENLTNAEKRMIKPLVNSGRRHWKSEQTYNPVIILTGTELFSNRGIPHCWKDKEGRAGEIEKERFYSRNLSDIADATQQIYLDMKPYHEWRAEQWQKRRKVN
ncbi:MAG: hypothetical protein KZQ92_22670 [Candidatus Thiodiazotropha sp. (ex Lucinoma borealis)]|nr:hypothetical protein [Candidatus Thiodiazotropha sp. (ex Lucinoma borealis)]